MGNFSEADGREGRGIRDVSRRAGGEETEVAGGEDDAAGRERGERAEESAAEEGDW